MPAPSPNADLELLLAAFLASAWRRPDTQVVDEPMWFETHTPSAPFGTHNGVRRCVRAIDVLDRHIRAAQDRHRATGTPIRWTVTPSCRPADLGERLVRQGFSRGLASRGMVRTTEPLDRRPPEVEVRPVATCDASTFAAVCGKAWGLQPAFMASIEHDTRVQIESGQMLYYLASVDGEPVGTAHTLLAPGSGYLMGGAVVADARGRGVYRALVDHRLAVLRERGVGLATVLALERSSLPICTHLGFREVGAFQDYTWTR